MSNKRPKSVVIYGNVYVRLRDVEKKVVEISTEMPCKASGKLYQELDKMRSESTHHRVDKSQPLYTKWVCHTYNMTRFKFIPSYDLLWLPRYEKCPFWLTIRWGYKTYIIKPIHMYDTDFKVYEDPKFKDGERNAYTVSRKREIFESVLVKASSQAEANEMAKKRGTPIFEQIHFKSWTPFVKQKTKIINNRTEDDIVNEHLESYGYIKSNPSYYRLFGILKSLLKGVSND